MGCWSENCALSGLELYDGCDVYAIMLKHEAASPFNSGVYLEMAPVYGKYDDYGGIDIVDDMQMFDAIRLPPSAAIKIERVDQILDRPARVNLRVKYQNKEGYRMVFFHKKIFDHLATLPTEFSRDDASTIGDACNHEITLSTEYFTDLRKSFAPVIGQSETERRLSSMMNIHHFSDIVRSLSISASGCNTSKHLTVQADLLTSELLDHNNYTDEYYMEKVAIFNEILRRTFYLIHGSYELRKSFMGSISGPQHGGVEALESFTHKTLELIAEYKNRYGYDE